MCGVLYFQQESRPLTVHASFILFGNNFTVYATIFILLCHNIQIYFLSCYKIHGGDLGSMDVRILLHLLLPLLLHRHRTDHLLLSNEHQQKVLKFRTYCRIISRLFCSILLLHLFVFVLLLLLLSDNIKEQHSVFKRVARLCRLWGQWLLHDNLAKKCNVKYKCI